MKSYGNRQPGPSRWRFSPAGALLAAALCGSLSVAGLLAAEEGRGAAPAAGWVALLEILGMEDLAQVGVPPSRDGGDAAGGEGWDQLREGWVEFADVYFLLDVAIVLLMAMLLGAAVAYHPVTRGKVSSIEEFEQPKTFIMYAMVGAVVGRIVLWQPVLGVVFFGIGGLLRFRTDVGEAKDTGRVILVTIVGVSCGLKLFVVAVLATLFGWLTIYYLESKHAERLQVKGLDRETIPEAADLYRELLTASGCKIIRERKNFLKGQVSFVFSAPRGFDRDEMTREFDALPKEKRGTIDWEIT